MIRNTTISTLLIGLLYFFLYRWVDRAVLLLVNTWTDNSVYQLCYYSSLLGTPKVWLGLSLTGFAFFSVSYFRNPLGILQYRILSLSFSVFLAQAIGTILKYSLGRARPLLFLQEHVYGFYPFTFMKLYHSTPSGHTLCIFAFACMASLQSRCLGGLCFFIAIVVGISRILLAEHYTSDVLLGAYIGIIAALIIQQALQKMAMNSNQI